MKCLSFMIYEPVYLEMIAKIYACGNYFVCNYFVVITLLLIDTKFS